ncbi:MAG: flagellar basal body L-ring protein FlgH [Burkholderiales bacterium]|nr:flagellar basal body L-ring protein FlgH [Burkholderiales bacterium]
MKKFFYIASLCGALGGCAVTPSTIVEGPTTARPQVPPRQVVANGSIYQSTSYRPMFEDRRARFVGDILTMTISEKTSATKAGANSGSKSGSSDSSITSVFGSRNMSIAAATDNKYEEKGAASSSNTFSGTIGVTVTEVLPNGYLVVAGEKQVAFDKGTEYIRFSGVVNPDQITSGNNILSSQVADTRVEYRTNTNIDKAEVMGMMTRFFLSVLPL